MAEEKNKNEKPKESQFCEDVKNAAQALGAVGVLVKIAEETTA